MTAAPVAELPKTAEAFVKVMAEAGVRLPVKRSASDVGVLLDADGRDVCTVDVNGERSDREAMAIVCWIEFAVNTRGGFYLERKDG